MPQTVALELGCHHLTLLFSYITTEMPSKFFSFLFICGSLTYHDHISHASHQDILHITQNNISYMYCHAKTQNINTSYIIHMSLKLKITICTCFYAIETVRRMRVFEHQPTSSSSVSHTITCMLQKNTLWGGELTAQ